MRCYSATRRIFSGSALVKDIHSFSLSVLGKEQSSKPRPLCFLSTLAFRENATEKLLVERNEARNEVRTTNLVKSMEKTEERNAPSMPPTYIHNGLTSDLIPYSRGWAWQQTLLNKRLDFQRKRQQKNEGDVLNDSFNNDEKDIDRDRLLLLQHTPVYTLGRGADEENLTFLDNEPNCGHEKRQRLSRKAHGKGSARLSMDRTEMGMEEAFNMLSNDILPVFAPNGAPIYRVDRGGEVTFHGPGQLVAYPLLDLRREPYKQDLHWYLRQVEEVVIQTLRAYEIDGTRDEENTGVWVGDKKIAAIGVSSSRWITTHGFAINISPNLSYFDTSVIIPCGIEGKGVTSIFEVMKEENDCVSCPSVEDVAETTVKSFKLVFGVETHQGRILD